MVLQQAPNQANIWGYTSDCEDKVTIKFIQEEYSTTLIKGTLSLELTAIVSLVCSNSLHHAYYYKFRWIGFHG